MNAILIKILAIGLALAQITTRSDAVKTEFDPVKDQAEIVGLLRDGCAHFRKEFAIEDINLDDLIATAMDDRDVLNGRIEVLRGLKFDDLLAAYRHFCKNSGEGPSPVDIGELAKYYNETLVGLPDHTGLKDQLMAGISLVLDQKGQPFAEIGDRTRRRLWVPLTDVPDVVQKAFVAAEDKRFYQHKGGDERGLIRALVGNLADPMRPQGGSTITQQVAKNLLVGGEVTFERKIRELVVASRLEQTYSKSQILELYLNSIYFGRGAWGIEMAAQNYFNKSAKDLTLSEGALLAALIKGPAYFNPDSHADRAHERLTYVLQRMVEDGDIKSQDMQQALAQTAKPIPYHPLVRDAGFYFVDDVAREARGLPGVGPLSQSPYTVHSTIDTDLQRGVEAALQEGLARYEMSRGQFRFTGAEANLGDAIARIEAKRGTQEPKAPESTGAVPSGNGGQPQAAASAATEPDPAWQVALKTAYLPLYDVHWTPAVIIDGLGDKRSAAIHVGLGDGRVLPLRVPGSSVRRQLKLYDVVYTHVTESAKTGTTQAELRVRPTVQGAAAVIENKTGRILAITGGFSYPLSQLNRATQSWRQPGSALKPVTYLAALKAGLGPKSYVNDAPITLAPIDGYRKEDYWTPKNYSGRNMGRITLETALEHSRNLATVHLLDGGIDKDPKVSLQRVCEIAREAKLYDQCEPYYPFVLGAQPVRVIDMAAFYAGIANDGMRPAPYAIESINQKDQVLYQHTPISTPIGPPDAVRFSELKMMLQGVVEKGTATSIRALAPYVAGKTGTTDDAADTWFVGFSNDVTVAVWVGYDNADGERRSLGDVTGNRVAAPIFGAIMQAVWDQYAPQTALKEPSKDMKVQMAALEAEARPEVISSSTAAIDARPRKVRVRAFRPPDFAADNDRFRFRGRGHFFGNFFENIWGSRLN